MKWFSLTLLLLAFQSIGQIDGYYQPKREIADELYANFTAYRHALFNRAFMDDSVLVEQLNGDFSRPTGIYEMETIHKALYYAYRDSNYMDGVSDLYELIDTLIFSLVDSRIEEELSYPLSLYLHDIDYIDFSTVDSNDISIVDSTMVPGPNEASLYTAVDLKAAGIWEFYPESGFAEGFLTYDPLMISTSPNINVLTLQLNVGRGFEPFGPLSKVAYPRAKDSTKATLAITYLKNNILQQDTLSFLLTTKGEGKSSASKSNSDLWDTTLPFVVDNDLEFLIGVKNPCDAENEPVDYRRPIIIVPPYNPKGAPFNMNKYYRQFNIAGFIDEMAQLGYTVFFIKEKPGNLSLEKVGKAVAEFINEINALKNAQYPDEHWENVLMGFSMGGQVAKYALKLLEMEHMDQGGPHHHTRLYVSFDSPHLGANIPMFTQLIYRDFTEYDFNLLAYLSYKSLKDEASRDMSIAHVAGSTFTPGPNNPRRIYVAPGITSERTNFINSLSNDFNHQYSHTQDLRVDFPSFSRNIAISTGHYNQNYEDAYGLNPGKLLFEQNIITLLYNKERRVYASRYDSNADCFNRRDLILVPGLFILRSRPLRIVNFDVSWGLEWDLEQGGYKDNFYDKLEGGAVTILKSEGLFLGKKYYDDHMSFLPLVSALNINPSIWANNNLTYDLLGNDLLFVNTQTQTQKFGYPNIKHPSNHFSITPFEAVYADDKIYEHILINKSLDEDYNSDYQSMHDIKNFINEEIEPEHLFLQNKVISESHRDDPSFRYQAWYKAEKSITIGKEVTFKTDPGVFDISHSGDFTFIAGEKIIIEDGFIGTAGAVFHFKVEPIQCSRSKSLISTNDDNEDDNIENVDQILIEPSTELYALSERVALKVYPNPNKGSFTVVVPQGIDHANVRLFTIEGKNISFDVLTKGNTFEIANVLPGTYILTVNGSKNSISKRIIVYE